MLIYFPFDIVDFNSLFSIILDINLWCCEIVLLGSLIYFSSSKIAKEILDVTAKTVGIIAGSTIIYRNVKGSGSSSTNDDKDKKDNDDKDKKDKENKTDDSNNETNTK